MGGDNLGIQHQEGFPFNFGPENAPLTKQKLLFICFIKFFKLDKHSTAPSEEQIQFSRLDR